MTIGDKAWWDAVKKVPRLTDEEVRFHMNAIWLRLKNEPQPETVELPVAVAELMERLAESLDPEGEDHGE